MSANDGYYELHRKVTKRRSLGNDYAYELHAAADVVCRGETRGRMLRKPATFSVGERTFTIEPTSKLANRWTATWSTGQRLALFDLANLGRGRTSVITDAATYTFGAADPALLDTIKAAVLLHTDTFQVTGPTGDVLAATGTQHPRGSPAEFARAVASTFSVGLARFAAVDGLTVVGGSWEPDPAFVMALLVYKDRVVDPVRTPA